MEDHVRVLLADNQVVGHTSLDMVFPTSVLTVVTVVVLAASCAAAHGELFATFAATVLVLYTMVLTEVHMVTQALVKCGARAATAGTSR